MAHASGKYAPLPLLANGRLDREGIRGAFDASPYLEWTDYARHQNYNKSESYRKLKPAKWVALKKERLINSARTRIQNFAISHREKWIDQVESTLQEYPKIIDNIMMLIANQMKMSTQVGGKPLSSNALVCLAGAARQCVEAKKSLLFLNSIVPKIEEEIPGAEEAASPLPTINLIGGPVTLDEAKRIMGQYLDKPGGVIDVEP